MTRHAALTPDFVEFVPKEIEEGVLYVSMTYGTAIHKCCCGCGQKVVTPLSPTDWKLTYDGEGVSLTPSIGNWSFPCQSHYWIEHNRVRWAPQWTHAHVEVGRKHDRWAKDRYYGVSAPTEPPQGSRTPQPKPRRSFLGGLLRWFLQ